MKAKATALTALLLLFADSAAYGAGPAEVRLVSLEFPPLEFLNKDGKPDGAAVQVVREVFSAMGLKPNVEILPWTRSLNLVREGQADAIFTAYRNPEREEFLDYSSEVLIPQVVSLYAKKGSPIVFSGKLKDLKSLTIGTLSTISYGSQFDQARTRNEIKTDRVEQLDLNFKKLLAGRIDLLVSNRYSAQVEITQLGIEGSVVELSPPVEVTPSYIGFSKKKGLARMRDEFDRSLRTLKKSGRYDEIMKKFNVRVPPAS